MPSFAESEFLYLESGEVNGSNCSASDNFDLSRASRDYIVRPPAFPCLHMTTILDDNGCATIDTGCQRMDIGINTLNRLQESQPSSLPMPISFCNEIHQFRSVRKASCTTKLACIPRSLGPHGCSLRPALFEDDSSADAPFLLSLPFLLHCQATLHLDDSQGLMPVSHRFGFKVQCYLGPTGAVRIPIQPFTDSMVQFLGQQCSRNRDEYELMQTTTEKHPTSSTFGSTQRLNLQPLEQPFDLTAIMHGHRSKRVRSMPRTTRMPSRPGSE
jgi:hypothetical protein